jgi:hypothetical protein
MHIIAASGQAFELAALLPSLISAQAGSAAAQSLITLISDFQAEANGQRAKRHVALNADGIEVSFSSKDFVLLEDHVAGLIFDLRCLQRGNWSSCDQFARDSQLLGRKWRLGTIEELFINVADRAYFNPAVNRDLFPMLKSEWVWSSTPDKDDDASSPVYAWGVPLPYGYAVISGRDLEGLALPVSSLGVSPGQ